MVMATALCTTAFAAKGQDGDVSAGHAFAREACKACHMVEAEENAPRMIAIGPAFRDIAMSPASVRRAESVAQISAARPTPAIPKSQFARIRAWVNYGMTAAQVAAVYGVAVEVIERILSQS